MSGDTLRYDGAVTRWFADFGGDTFAKDTRKWITRRPVPRDEVPPTITEWLTGPITASIPCVTTPQAPSNTRHAATIDPGTGTYVFHAHGYTAETIESELMLLALTGTRIPPCLVALAILTDQYDLIRPLPDIDRSLIRAWRAYLTARTWALPHPHTSITSNERAILISTATTPEQWTPWAQAGYAPGHVAQFLALGTPLERAKPWLEADLVGKHAAAGALRGETPFTDHSAWAALNIDRHQATRWHAYTGATPTQAARFIGLYVTPEQVRKAITDIPLDLLLTWVEAGMPVKDTRAWVRAGVNLDDALILRRAKVPPAMFRRAAYMLALRTLTSPGTKSSTGVGTRRHPKPTEDQIDTAARSINVASFVAWRTAGIPDHLISEAAIADWVTPEEITAWGPLPHEVSARMRGLSEWVVLIRSLPRHRFDAWESHPITQPWTQRGESSIEHVVHLERTGFTPEVIDNYTHNHRQFLARAENAATPVQACGSVEDAEAVLASGLLRDNYSDGTAYILPRDVIAAVAQWRKSTPQAT